MGKEPPVMTTRGELKKEVAREEWKKLISQGWLVIPEVWLSRAAHPPKLYKPSPISRPQRFQDK